MIDFCALVTYLLEPSAMPAWLINAYTDAAGGSTRRLVSGSWGVCEDQWFYYPWSLSLNNSFTRVNGIKVTWKFSALELIGPLIVVVKMSKNKKNLSIICVNNAVLCCVYIKWDSNSCPFCTTLVKAISTISSGVGPTVLINKISKC